MFDNPGAVYVTIDDPRLAEVFRRSVQPDIEAAVSSSYANMKTDIDTTVSSSLTTMKTNIEATVSSSYATKTDLDATNANVAALQKQLTDERADNITLSKRVGASTVQWCVDVFCQPTLPIALVPIHWKQ